MAKIDKVQEVAIADLKPYDKNAKVHSDEQVDMICNSIEEFGFISPCLIDKDNRIIAGHGRVMAAKKLGLKKVPCVYIEGLTEEQYRAYILVDNKLTELGGWDFDLLNSEFDDIDLDMSQFGFDIETDNEAVDIVEDEIPETPKKAKSKLGQIYQLGEHRLICGDATDASTFEKLMNGHRADIAFTSPPYNAGHLDVALSPERGGGTQKATQKKYLADNDEKTDEEYMTFLQSNIDLLLGNAYEIFYNIGVGAGSKRTIAELLYIYKDNFKDLLYWVKDNPMPVIAKGVMSSATELIIAFGENGNRAFNNFDDRLFHGVIQGHSASSENQYADIHKATFPVYLPSEIISRFTKEGGSVLDCFGGTGTTLMACEQLNRKCYMIELEPVYVDVIIERWETLTGKKARKVNG